MHTVGIVGLGHVARHQLAALKLSRAFTLIAGCDTDERAFDLLEHPVRTFKRVEEMLAVQELDVVVVASPNRLHVEHGIAAMAAGKWVVMEKPLAETRSEFERFSTEKTRLGGRCTFALHAAHGLEVDWLVREQGAHARGNITEFDARFYDPYFEDGRLLAQARSLGGSWTDSGINALSVICRFLDPKSLSIRDSRMSRVANTDCREVQGTVDFTISGGSRGRGAIDTNWTLGRNFKSTMLRFGVGDSRYVLDHSNQRVLLGDDESGARVQFVCNNGHPRLTNHYVGVFDELAKHMDHGEDNFVYGEALHHLLYGAEEWCDLHANAKR